MEQYFAGTLLLAASLSTPAAQRPLSLLDVPFISQSEALCGGAAAAMVLRYWGASGVSAEDFAPLVDRSAAGIQTAALAAAVADRGFNALPAAGTAPLAQTELANGRPVIALIEDRPGAFHYVVIVGWHDRAIVLHDPARTPYVLMQPREFERRWQASRNWMLAVTPASTSRAAGPGSLAPSSRIEADSPPSSCDALVDDGVRLAQENELAEAERLLAAAAYQCPGAAPLRELAGVRLLQRRWPEVRELAGRAVTVDPGDAHAWRLLATSRYIEGDHAGALDAWNRVGEPLVDLIAVSGLQRTTHRTVERLIGLDAGAELTRSGFERARRRLDELPAAFSTRLEYLPRGSGRAEVRAHVAERSVVPAGLLTWAAIGMRAAASREVEAGVASALHGGERLDARWRFWPSRPAFGVALRAPAASAGLFSLELFSERQPFSDVAVPDAKRFAARAALADWSSEWFRWQARGGVERREEHGTYAVVGGATRIDAAPWRVNVSADAWIGGQPSFAAGQVSTEWRSSRARRGLVLLVHGGFDSVHHSAPLDLWPAGDTGHARASLLRAHPLIDDGRLRVERLGRQLAYANVEAQHWWRSIGPLALGGAAFLDAARTASRRAGPAIGDLDVGAGLRIALPGRPGELRLDVGHGLRDGNTAFSVAWTP